MNKQEQPIRKGHSVGFALLATLVVVAVLLPFSWYFAPMTGVTAVLATGLSCLASYLVVLPLSDENRSGNVGLLLSTGVRMGLVLGICIITREGWPALAVTDFYLWVILVYLTLLTVDTVHMVQSLPLSRRIST